MRTGPRLLVVLALVASCRALQPTEEDTDGRDALRATLSTRYRGRVGPDDRDHDLSQSFDGSYEDPESRFSARIFGQVFWDVDGSEATSPFFGLRDTREDRLTGRLYQAWVDVDSVDELELLRVGRQELYDTPVPLYFDGVRAETPTGGTGDASLGVYGGIPSHPWESSTSGDAVAGAYARFESWRNARLRIEWMHLEDERLTTESEDDLFGMSLTQSLPHGESVTRLAAAFTALEDEGRDLRLSGNHYDPGSALSLDVSWYELLSTQGELSAPLDPFYSSLLELHPYRRFGASASKAWQRFDASAGLLVRSVDDEADVGQFNRDYERYYVSGAWQDPVGSGSRLALTGELWDNRGEAITSWGLDLEGELEAGWCYGVGSYYSLFKYDYTTGTERDEVRTHYLDLSSARGRRSRFSMRYEIEGPETYHGLRMGYTWTY